MYIGIQRNNTKSKCGHEHNTKLTDIAHNQFI